MSHNEKSNHTWREPGCQHFGRGLKTVTKGEFDFKGKLIFKFNSKIKDSKRAHFGPFILLTPQRKPKLQNVFTPMLRMYICGCG